MRHELIKYDIIYSGSLCMSSLMTLLGFFLIYPFFCYINYLCRIIEENILDGKRSPSFVSCPSW